MMDSSEAQNKRLLRSLELKAFHTVVDALRAQGPLTANKRQVLKNLAVVLKIGNERYRCEIRRAVNDSILNRIAQCADDGSDEENWCSESVRRIAFMPMVAAPTAFTALADKVSYAVVSNNVLPGKPMPTLIELLESKKNRTSENASRYHATKLLAPLRSLDEKHREAISIELEKMKSHQTQLADNFEPMEVQLSSHNAMNVSLCENDVPTTNVVKNERIEICCDDVETDKLPSAVWDGPDERPLSPITVTKCSSAVKQAEFLTSSSCQNEVKCEMNAAEATNTASINLPENDASIAPLDNHEQHPTEKILNDSIDRIPVEKRLVKSNNLLDNNLPSVPSNATSRLNEYSTVLRKDVSLHTFNLIPASRRLKSLKKIPPVTSFPAETNSVAVSSFPPLKLKTNDLAEKDGNVCDTKKLLSTDFASVLSANHSNTVASLHEKTKKVNEKVQSVLPASIRTKKTLSLLGNITVHNLNANTEDESFGESTSSDEEDMCKYATEEELTGNSSDSTLVEECEIISSSECSDLLDENDSLDAIEVWSPDGGSGRDEKNNNISGESNDDSNNIIKMSEASCADAGSQNATETIEILSSATDKNECIGVNDVTDSKDEKCHKRILIESADDVVSGERKSIGDGVDVSVNVKENETTENTSAHEHLSYMRMASTSSGSASKDNSSAIELISIAERDEKAGEQTMSVKSSQVERENLTTEMASPTPKDEHAYVTISPSLLTVNAEATTTTMAIAKNSSNFISTNAPKIVIANPKNQKLTAPMSLEPKPSSNIIAGRTITISNARCLIAPSKSNNQLQAMPKNIGVIADYPKIRLCSTPVLNSGSDLSKRILISKESKQYSDGVAVKMTSQIVLPSLKRDSAQPITQHSIPPKVCRLYNLADFSKSATSNSSTDSISMLDTKQK